MSNNKGLTPAMTIRPLALAIAAALATVGTAHAEPLFQVPLYGNADMSRYSDNYIELGGAYSNNGSYGFGEWNGITRSGGYVLGNFHYNNRDAARSPEYFDVLGTNLGFDSRYVSASYANQGRWSVGASYQGLPHNAYDTTRFIYGGLGGNSLYALTSVTGAGTANPNAGANPGRLNAAAQSFNIDTMRDVWKIGGTAYVGPGMSLSLNYRQDNRDGNTLGYGAFFQGGGNPRSAALVLPVNDTHNQVEAVFGWTGATAQANVSYWWSRYNNNNDSVIFQNPFVNVTGWPGGQGYPNSYGQSSLAPGNTYNQISTTGAWNFARNWRANGTLLYGRGTQDQGYLPYYITVAPPANPLLPQGNLNGTMDRWLADIGVNGRPIDKLTLRFKYRYDENNNKTGTNGYNGSWGSIVQNAAATQNVPYGYLKTNLFRADADYAVIPRTFLGGGYEYRHTDYKYEDRSSTTDNIFRLEARRVANEFATGGIRYTYQVRTGTDVETVNPTTLAVQVIPYFLNNYTQNRVRAFVDLTPTEKVGVNLSVDWISRDYSSPSSNLNCSTIYTPAPGPAGTSAPANNGCYGLDKATWTTATIDMQWRPLEKLGTFLFYTYGDLANEQVDKQFNNAATLVSPFTAWNATLKNKSNTIGTGASFNPNGDIDVGLTYIYNWGQQSTDIAANPIATTAARPGLGTQLPLADNNYRLNSFQLFAKYKVNKNWALRANYWYEGVTSSDWAYSNVAVFSSDRTVFAAQQATRYSNNVFGLSVSYTGF
jgi:MtrB/PioB family decaheme-associated outer membrane protein